MSLEAKPFTASPTEAAEIARITRAVLDAQATNSSGRTSYLQVLITQVQHQLGSSPKQRQGAIGKTTDSTRETQIATFKAVEGEYYKIVKHAAQEKLGVGRTAKALNTATNFARSSKTTLLAWLRAGNDITDLAAAKVTKASLTVGPRHKTPSVAILANRTHRWADRLLITATTFVKAEPATARTVLQEYVDRLLAILSPAAPVQRRAAQPPRRVMPRSVHRTTRRPTEQHAS